jgi:ribosomal protein L7/L12
MSEIKNQEKNNETVNVNEILESIKKLSVAKINELTELIKEEFNIKGDVNVAPSSASEEDKEEKEEKKTINVSVKIDEIGANKIPIYKLVSG